MLLIADFSCEQNLSAPCQAIVVCPVIVVPRAWAAVYLEQESFSIRAKTSPALERDPALENQHCPRDFQSVPQNHKEVSDVCLLTCFGKRKKGQNEV